MKHSHLSAQVQLSEGGFEAVLSDGRHIFCGTIEELADALSRTGVPADAVFCGDWREGDRILLTGQKIALHARMRKK